MTPNRDNIQKWVDALRSGEYKQCYGVLSDGEGYCCLGVACKISGKRWNELAGMLSNPVMEWLGVADDDPQLGVASASQWNDCDRLTFPQIADLIEAKYLKGAA